MKSSMLIVAIALFVTAFYFSGLTIRSADYHDGAYHPIPRERYAITMLGCLLAGAVLWRVAKRISPP